MINVREGRAVADDLSNNESLCSISSKDLEPLCDQDVYSSFADVLSDSVRLKIAKLRSKHPFTDSGKLDPDASPSKKCRVVGNVLKEKSHTHNPVEFPDIYYTTENEGAHLPLSLFHPEAVRHVATNLATIGLTRINPWPGEPKGRTILDIKRLTDIFGDNSNPTFTYNKYLKLATSYLNFQASCDAHTNLFSGVGNGECVTFCNHMLAPLLFVSLFVYAFHLFLFSLEPAAFVYLFS
jgi:hypothetical protein